MKCYYFFLFFTLISCATASRQGDDIKISVDVDELPEIGLGISTTEYNVKLVHFNSTRHGEHVIHDAEAAYLTLHNGFSERKQIYAEKGDHIHLSFDGKKTTRNIQIHGRPSFHHGISRPLESRIPFP